MWKFFGSKKSKNNEAHAYKGYASTYSVKMLNSFNPELQFKETESTIKNELIDLLTELKGFKSVATLVLGLKVMIKQYIAPFIWTQKQKQLLMKVTLMMHFNQSIALLYQTYKNL